MKLILHPIPRSPHTIWPRGWQRWSPSIRGRGAFLAANGYGIARALRALAVAGCRTKVLDSLDHKRPAIRPGDRPGLNVAGGVKVRIDLYIHALHARRTRPLQWSLFLHTHPSKVKSATFPRLQIERLLVRIGNHVFRDLSQYAPDDFRPVLVGENIIESRVQ